MTSSNAGAGTISTGQNHVGSQIGQDDAPASKPEETSKSEGTQAGGTLQHHTTNTASTKSTSTGTGIRTKDYNDEMVCRNVNIKLLYNTHGCDCCCLS